MTKHKTTILTLLLAVTWFLLMAENIAARELPADAVLARIPTAQPDRIVLSWSGEPATTQSVNWRTSTDIQTSFAELAQTRATPKFHADKQTFAAKCELVESTTMNYHSHSMTFTGLIPNTMYSYRVGQEGNWSEWFTFTTGSQTEQPFAFLYFGDAQNGLDTVYPQVVRKAFLTLPDAKFALFAGDLVSVGKNEREWDQWFDAIGFLSAMYPIMPVPGNHEHDKMTDTNGVEHRPLSNLWRPLFTLPEHGPDTMKETCYTFVYNGVRFIALDSTKGAYEFRGEGEIAAWLERILKDNTSCWTIVYFHHPIYSSAKERNHAEWRGAIKPLLDKYRVDIVLQGHDHVYTRTGLQTPHVDVIDLENVTELDSNSRTVYVTSVAGEKMYELQSRPFFEKTLADTQLFQTIRIAGNTLTLTAKTVTGEEADSFTLEKQ